MSLGSTKVRTTARASTPAMHGRCELLRLNFEDSRHRGFLCALPSWGVSPVWSVRCQTVNALTGVGTSRPERVTDQGMPRRRNGTGCGIRARTGSRSQGERAACTLPTTSGWLTPVATRGKEAGSGGGHEAVRSRWKNSRLWARRVSRRCRVKTGLVVGGTAPMRIRYELDRWECVSAGVLIVASLAPVGSMKGRREPRID